jgi:hypothetical protein
MKIFSVILDNGDWRGNRFEVLGSAFRCWQGSWENSPN